MFRDRGEAGLLLAEKLEQYRGKNAVVLALPRGGVVTGEKIATALGLPLDIIAVRKIGHPSNPEYAVGAVDEKGTAIFNEVEKTMIDNVWLTEEIERQKQEAKRRSALYRGGKEPAKIGGNIVIIVDDGIATALTMRLAVRSVKMQGPASIIVAVPVAPPESIDVLIREGADDVIVLESPELFAGAVGAHYVHFDQVEDDEVIALLQ